MESFRPYEFLHSRHFPYKEKDMTKYVYAIMYNWGDKKYLELEKRLLTDDELQEINGQLIDEKEVD